MSTFSTFTMLWPAWVVQSEMRNPRCSTLSCLSNSLTWTGMTSSKSISLLVVLAPWPRPWTLRDSAMVS